MQKRIYDIEQRIDGLHAEIMNLEKELLLVKKELELGQVVQQPVEQPVQPVVQQPVEQPVQPVVQNSVEKVQPAQAAKSKDMESAIGKYIMGIAASVLIFISLVLFATLIIPHLTDAVRQILMYVFSVGFTAFGLIKLNKKKSPLFLAISACGVGSIYISLFMSCVHFNSINEIVLYVALLLWAVFVCWLSKYKSSIFHIIGECGILISVFYGTLYCVQQYDISKLCIIVIYMIVGNLIFYFTHNKDEKDYMLNNLFNLLTLVIALFGMTYLTESNDITITSTYALIMVIIIAAYMVLMMVLPMIWSGINGKVEGRQSLFKQYEVAACIFTTLYFVVMAFFIRVHVITSDTLYWGVILIMAIIFLIVAEMLTSEKADAGRGFMVVVLTFFAMLATFGLSILNASVGVALLIVPYVLYGFKKPSTLYKVLGVLLLIPFIFNFEIPVGFALVLGAIMIAMTAYLDMTVEGQYSVGIKNLLYLLLIGMVIVGIVRIGIDTDIKFRYILLAGFGVLAILNMLAMKTKFAKNPVTGNRESETGFLLHFIHSILMIWGMSGIGIANGTFMHLTYILLTLALFLVNAGSHLVHEKYRFLGVYTGVKFTVLMIVILNSFDAANYAISICCFIFAIASIVVGFGVKHKGLRIYGLILSLLSVVKLVMIDITYDNTLGNALSFFVSGILCFVISAIYTYVDKKISERSIF